MDRKEPQWKTNLREKIPDKQVILVPSHAFFSQRVAKPEGIDKDDLENFIALTLEATAPFPIEQLLYGYLTFENSEDIFLYATPKSRLQSLGIEGWDHCHQLLPAFLAFDIPGMPAGMDRFIASGTSLSLVRMDQNSRIPRQILTRSLKNEIGSDEAFEKLAQEMRLALPPEERERIAPKIWIVRETEVLLDQSIRWSLRSAGSLADSQPVFVPCPKAENGIWALDIRDPLFAAKEASTRKRGLLLWRILIGMGVAAAIILLLQITIFGLGFYNTWQGEKLSALEGRVNRIENKLTLAERLTQSAEADVKPYRLLEAINPLRPTTIYYNRVRSRSYNSLEIEGESSAGVNPVNAFADAIQKLPYVSNLENLSQTRTGKTSFEFTVTFSELPPEVDYTPVEEITNETTEETSNPEE